MIIFIDIITVFDFEFDFVFDLSAFEPGIETSTAV